MSLPEYAIELADASKTFNQRTRALKQVSLRVRPGECIALLGASGSGKSTLLRSLCGLELLDPGAGFVKLNGRLLQAGGRLGSDARLLRQHTGIIFQQFNLVGRMSLLTNVLTGLLAPMPIWRTLLGRFNEAERMRAVQALEAVGLADLAQQRASTLSGGQQQRAAIARTLAQGASIVLADEPVASLDPESTRRVMDLLQDLNTQHQVTLVMSLHNVALARRYCDRIVALRDGVIVFDGVPAQLDDREVHKLYGSQSHELVLDTGFSEVTTGQRQQLAAAS
jgi:phosphonate transport system ATP-binding protein